MRKFRRNALAVVIGACLLPTGLAIAQDAPPPPPAAAGAPAEEPQQLEVIVVSVEIVYRKELAAADDPVAKRAELVDEYTERFCNPYVAAERGFVDDVIDPAETRRKLVAGLELLRSKREELPKRKHGNVPL